MWTRRHSKLLYFYIPLPVRAIAHSFKSILPVCTTPYVPGRCVYCSAAHPLEGGCTAAQKLNSDQKAFA